MVGKWHLCPDAEMNLASTRRNWPTGRGFERFYGFLGAETNQWYPGPGLRQPSRRPADARRRRATTSPWTSPTRRSSSSGTPRRSRPRSRSSSTTPRAPATRPTTRPRSGSTVQGPVRHGLRGDARADARPPEGARHRPAGHRAAADQPDRDARDPHRPRRQAVPAAGLHAAVGLAVGRRAAAVRRMAEVYAGFLAHADDQIGRLLDYLEETGQRENTMVVLVSDNGASGEGGPNGSVNENKFANGIPDDIAENLALLDELGGPKTYNHYPNGWAMAFNTPFKMWKRYEFNGGTSRPVHHLLAGGHRRRSGEIREQYHHAIDLVPTILDVARRRAARDDQAATSRATSTASACATASTTPTRRATRETQFYSMLGSRGIWHDGWKAVTTHPTLSGWGHFNEDTWELYHTDVDRSELHNLAARAARDRLQELVNLWYAEAGANGAFPLDDRSRAGDHPHAAAAAHPAAQPLHLLPRTRRGAGVAGGQRPQPLVHDRRPGRPPGGRRRGRPVRARLAVRRPRPVPQGRPAALRLQLRRHARAAGRRDRGPPDRRAT